MDKTKWPRPTNLFYFSIYPLIKVPIHFLFSSAFQLFILEKVCGIFHLSIIVEYSTVDLKKKEKEKEYSTMCQCLVGTQHTLSMVDLKPRESAQKFGKEQFLTAHLISLIKKGLSLFKAHPGVRPINLEQFPCLRLQNSEGI